MDDQSLFQLRCELEVYLTEREAMIASNKQHEMAGHPLIHGYKKFENIKYKINLLAAEASRR
jgi:hypothetical protein